MQQGDGEGVPENVVQFPGDAVPFLYSGLLGQPRLGRAQLREQVRSRGRTNRLNTPVKVAPASQAPQPGSGWTQSHSTPNKIIAPAQYTRPTRRPPVSTHHPASRHAANQQMLFDRPSATTATPAVAAAA